MRSLANLFSVGMTIVLMMLSIGVGCSNSAAPDKSAEKSSVDPPESSSRPSIDARVAELFGDEETAQLVFKAEQAQAFRLPPKSFQERTVDEYKMNGEPVAMNKDIVKRLTSLLLDAKSYGWDMGKGCEPDYGVRVRFTHDSKAVDVFFCFGCDILAIYKNGKEPHTEDFDSIRKPLVAIMKEVFPNDKVIQELTEAG